MTGGVEAGVLGVAAEVIINEGAGLGEVERAVMAVRAYSKDGDGRGVPLDAYLPALNTLRVG